MFQSGQTTTSDIFTFLTLSGVDRNHVADQIRRRIHHWIHQFVGAAIKPLVIYMYPEHELSQSKQKGLALIRFEKLSDLEKVHLALCKHNSELRTEAGEIIKVGLAYDSRCLGETRWVGTVLRNIPPEATTEGIRLRTSANNLNPEQVQKD